MHFKHHIELLTKHKIVRKTMEKKMRYSDDNFFLLNKKFYQDWNLFFVLHSLKTTTQWL